LLGNNAPATTCICTPFPHFALVVPFKVFSMYLSQNVMNSEIWKNCIWNEDLRGIIRKIIGRTSYTCTIAAPSRTAQVIFGASSK